MFSGSCVFVVVLSVGSFTDCCKISASFNKAFFVSSPPSWLIVVDDFLMSRARRYHWLIDVGDRPMLWLETEFREEKIGGCLYL